MGEEIHGMPGVKYHKILIEEGNNAPSERHFNRGRCPWARQFSVLALGLDQLPVVRYCRTVESSIDLYCSTVTVPVFCDVVQWQGLYSGRGSATDDADPFTAMPPLIETRLLQK